MNPGMGVPSFLQSSSRQADVLIRVIQPAERREEFTFVYPILFDDWDATRHVTAADGPYRGVYLYEVNQNTVDR